MLEQLKKAGLVSEQKAKKAKRKQYQQNKQQKSQNHKKSTPQLSEAAQLVAEEAQKKAENDRKIQLEQQQKKLEKEKQAELKQVISSNQMKATEGELTYQFSDNKVIKTLHVNAKTRQGLIAGRIRIVSWEGAYLLVSEEAVAKIELRDASVLIPLAEDNSSELSAEDEAYYAKFAIPDDLVW